MILLRNLFTVAAFAAVLTLNAQAAPKPPQTTGTVDVKSGQTKLEVNSSFFVALTAAGIAASSISPGKIVVPKAEIRFPIVGGSVDLQTLAADVIHSGGVNFSSEETSISIVDLILNIPAPGSEGNPSISAVLVVDGQSRGRIAAFTVAAPELQPPLEVVKNKLSVTDVDLTLTPNAATALNQSFGVNFFSSATVLGTASFSANVVKGSL